MIDRILFRVRLVAFVNFALLGLGAMVLGGDGRPRGDRNSWTVGKGVVGWRESAVG